MMLTRGDILGTALQRIALRALFIAAAMYALVVVPADAGQQKTVYNFSVEQHKVTYARELGATTPPMGWVQFCATHPEDCNVRAGERVRVKLDSDRWTELKQINSFVNKEIEPFTDEELHNVAERWSYPVNAGDCEDYVLLKRRYLMDLGWPREALLITVVLDKEDAGHAVLTVITDKGEFVLDNQEPEVKTWTDTPYTFLKRQSQEHPMQWVSLNHRKNRKALYVSGN